MDIQKYKTSEHFDRNEAIFILHTVDNKSLEELADNFQLAIEELQKIITLHAQYEAVLAA